MEWIQAHWTPGRTTVAPARALLAGCGTGAEAFAFSRRFPHAEIVAVDFSRRTIERAREYQQRDRHRRNVRFVVADLSAPGLERLIGGNFDLISCYGVLSYVPKAGRAFENLSRCLATDGALGIGVNGAGHASVGMRAALPGFGYDVSRFADEPRVWQVLSLFDALLGHTQLAERVAARSADVVASDIFGALIQDLPLSGWVRRARSAGLHFQNSFSSHWALRLTVEQGLCELLMPRSRARVSALLETLRPAPFHMLLFTRQPVVDPPWRRPKAVEDWRPLLTGLFPLKRRPPLSGALRTVRLDSSAINTRIEWPMTQWQRALLCGADGRRAVRRILGAARAEVPPRDVAEFLYVLHQLVVIAMLPPRTPDR